MAVSSPARNNLTSFAASRRSVLIRWPGRRGVSAGAMTEQATPVEIVAGDPRFVARGDGPLAIEPFEQAPDLARVVHDLAKLGLCVARAQDSRDDLPLAVVERHVGSILLHDRPPIACGSVPARNNPRLCDTAGRSFHIV